MRDRKKEDILDELLEGIAHERGPRIAELRAYFAHLEKVHEGDAVDMQK